MISTLLSGSSQQSPCWRSPSQHQWAPHCRIASLPGAVPSKSRSAKVCFRQLLLCSYASPRRLTLRAILRASIVFPEPIRARISSPVTETWQEAEAIADALPIQWAAYAVVIVREAWRGVGRDVAVREIAVLGGGEGGSSEEEGGGKELHVRRQTERIACAVRECEMRCREMRGALVQCRARGSM